MKKIATGRARREQRQREAVERNTYTAGLSLKDRIKVVLSRRGESRRELARLNAALGNDGDRKDAHFKKIHAAA